MYKKDLALSNLQWLICHKTKPNQTRLCHVIVSEFDFHWVPHFSSLVLSLVNDNYYGTAAVCFVFLPLSHDTCYICIENLYTKCYNYYGTVVFNWNHFEMRLLNLRINFLFIADSLSSSW